MDAADIDPDSSGELIIDVGPANVSNTKLRKRTRSENTISSEEENVGNINDEEIQKKISSVASKNNLTSESVKKILKKVILNEHVWAIVKLREEEIDNEHKNMEPKLTRAKTKKLKSSSSSVSWPLPITPVKATKPVSPEVNALISQDLPEEESDEEYKPDIHDQSDDEKTGTETSDIDSLPTTPLCENIVGETEMVTNDNCVKYSDDGIFKIPKNVVTNTNLTPEETIALRTRSKLSLNDIPIEQIEESFHPPDITKDMYELDDLNADDVWKNFLKEFSKPLSNTNEDDEDADPEYNAASEIEIFDIEELREDDDVEVPRNELKDLIEELGIVDNFDIEDLGYFDSNTYMTQIEINAVPLKNSDIQSQAEFESKSDVFLQTEDLLKDDQSQRDISHIIKCEENSNNMKLNYENNIVNCSEASNLSHKDVMCKTSLREDSQELSVDQLNINTNIVSNINCNNNENNNVLLKSQEKHSIEKDENVDEASHTPIFIQNLKKQSEDFQLFEGYKTWEGSENIEFFPEQRSLLDQQVRQHVQLLAQCFVQVYGHPVLWNHGPKLKELLVTLKYLGNENPNSAFISCNLLSAIKLCDDWEKKLSVDSSKTKEYMNFVLQENNKMFEKKKHNKVHYAKFPDLFLETILDSTVFIYPNLLPTYPCRVDRKIPWLDYLNAEDQLIAMGLEQFYEYLQENNIGRFSKKHDPMGFTNVTNLIHKYMMPFRCSRKLRHHITRLKVEKRMNPVKYFFKYGRAPKTLNKILPYNPNVQLEDHPVEALPYTWQQQMKSRFCARKSSVESLVRRTASRLALASPSVSWRTLPPPIRRVSSPVLLLSLPAKPQQPTSKFVVVNTAPNVSVTRLCDKDQKLITDYFHSDRNTVPPDVNLHSNIDCRLTSRLSRLLRTNLGECAVNFLSNFVLLSQIKQTLRQKIVDLDAKMLPSMPHLLTTESCGSNQAVIENVALDCEAISAEKAFTSKRLPDEKCTNQPKSTLQLNASKQRVAVKAQKELEANRAMFVDNDPDADDLKETLYAAAYLDKVRLRLQAQSCDSTVTFENFQNILSNFNPAVDKPIDLYRKIDLFFGNEQSDLTEEFLTFLSPGQASELGRFMDHFMLSCMSDFIEKLQIYLVNKPARLRKVLWCLEKLIEKSESELTIDVIKSSIIPLLKGNQYLIDRFLKLFPNEKPPDSLSNGGYEVIDCNRIDKVGTDNIITGLSDFEILDIPAVEENYGNESCTCSCHNSSNDKFRVKSRHCLACGMKYIQGRVYMQHGRALRSVHINWYNSVNGHIDQARRLSAPLSPRQINSRRRPASNEPLVSKNDSDEERVSPKRATKFAKMHISKGKKITNCSRNVCKALENIDQEVVNHKVNCSKSVAKMNEVNSSFVDNKKSNSRLNSSDDHENISQHEDYFEIQEGFHVDQKFSVKEEQLIVEDNRDEICSIESNEMIVFDCSQNSTQAAIHETRKVNKMRSSDEALNIQQNASFIKSEQIDSDKEEFNSSTESYSNQLSSVKLEEESSWTRSEDKIILLILRNESHDNEILAKIRDMLPHRSLDDIRARLQSLMNVLKKITSPLGI